MMKTTNQFLADTRRQLMLPNTATLGLTDAEVLSAADMEMNSRIMPLILSINEEYGVQTMDIPVVPGQTQYRMPARCAGAKLRDIRFVYGQTQLPLPKIEIEQLQNWTINARGTPVGFYLQAGSVNLVPAPGSGVIRVRFYQPHGKYVAWGGTSNTVAGVIGSVVGYSTTVAQNDTIEFTVPTFTPVLNSQYDIIAQSTPYEFLTLSSTCIDAVSPYKLQAYVANPSLPVMTLSPNVVAGDIVTAAGNVPVIQLPDEAYQLLVYRTCVALLIQMGDMERGSSMETLYGKLEAAYLKMFAPRVDGSPKTMQGLMQSGFNAPYYFLR